MSLARLHCIGRGHEARFSEDFDQALAAALSATPTPLRAAAELDDVALLTVLANFAGAGPYDPSEPASANPLLELDAAQPVLRVFRWHWWWAGTPMGRFAFAGRTLTTSQTVVFQARFEPVRRGGAGS